MARTIKNNYKQPPKPTAAPKQVAQLITSLAASIVAQVSSFSNREHRENQRQLAIEGGLR